MRLTEVVIFATPLAVSCFSASRRVTTVGLKKRGSHMLWISSEARTDENNGTSEGNEGLVLDGLDQEMDKVASKFAFSESEFLAAAKKRAEQRVESKNASAQDDDWKTLAEEKKTTYGEIDDWENSTKEAGNTDSQILMFIEPPADGDPDGDVPKLLLF